MIDVMSCGAVSLSFMLEVRQGWKYFKGLLDTAPNEPVFRHDRWGILVGVQQVSCSRIIRNTPKDAVPFPGKGKGGGRTPTSKVAVPSGK